MMPASPQIILLAGPNGAGKTTAAPRLLKGLVRVTQFVNVDTIAQGLAGFQPEDAAVLAARVMWERVHQLVARRASLAIETTLASRSLASYLRHELADAGYRSHLFFVWLPNVEIAIARVHERQRLGGHGVPEHVIRRRYSLGVINFFNLYTPLVTKWRVYNNDGEAGPRLVASGSRAHETRVIRTSDWETFCAQSKGC